MTTLLLHSSGLTGRQWRGLIRELPGPRLAPTYSGYPGGPSWTEGPAWEADTEVILQILDGLEGPVDLVGHSYGGAVALRVAVRRPDRIRRMVLHDPVVWGMLEEDGQGTLEDSLGPALFDRLLCEETGGDEPWLEAFLAYWNGEGAWQSMSERNRAALLQVGRKVFREVWDLCTDRTPASAYDGVECPVRITMGADSPSEERRVCHTLAGRLPQRELCVLPCGHMAPLTHPKLFHRMVREFLIGD
jgi:pimeloyl-ACP methyl ester carboxylesterase